MCYYITSTFPDQVDIEKAKKTLDRYHLQFNEILNSWILKQIPNRRRYFRPTLKICDCGTELGSLNGNKKKDHKSDTDKLKKKGWSQSKINRWVKERNAYQIKNSVKFDSYKNHNLSEGGFWYQFINDWLQISKEFGLLLHWYDGTIEEENFELKKIQKIKIEDISEMFFSKMEYDTLYLFQK
ncbi:hypothetical protein [Leptospira borgpetersenii]|uniref:hypothetical protein n=1 Tax=Leptospira borgpetersenii TaxID=174 RepID=UPI000344B0BF|nr:hypothetical protein [Leptospira borgpetersenii]URD69016.1 hypothetical protein LIX26_09830 [Leptospira borgpetersenii]UVD72193.1 hypothetical protein NU962_09890 [Leptospira borgpetersenii]UVD75377.1 hypothetical protein LIX27_09935 [Leptospira borgpetersenii]UZW31933.1 hypothetical protein OR565_09940 [Leptospira borgpetersenii]